MSERRVFQGNDLREVVARAGKELQVDEVRLQYEVLEGESGEGRVRIAVTVPSSKETAESVEPATPLTDVATDMRRFVGEVIQRTGLSLSVDVAAGGETLVVRMSGSDRDLVLQDRAELLEAIQYLLSRVFSRRLNGRRVLVDCDGFRAQKEGELREIARRASQKVKLTGQQQEIGLLNPYERRIVHLAVASLEGVTTESSGDGFLKRITILPE